jgi:hypothetical protein
VKSVIKKHLIIGIIIAAFLSSCKGESHDKEMTDINNLRIKLVRTDSILKKIDQEEAERLATELKNNSQFIQFNINKIGDTIDFKTSLLLNNYHSLLPAFEAVADNHKKIAAAVDSTNTSLNYLEHDIQNNSLAKNLTPEGCIEQEEEQVNEMYEYAATLRPSFDKAKKGYDSLSPKIADYMKSLNQKLADKMAAPKK